MSILLLGDAAAAASASTETPAWAWGVFGALVVGMLAIDLFIFNRKAQTHGIRQALAWTVVWIALAALFGAGVHYVRGPHAALEYATAYLVEKSLSIDNIFIFIVIFRYFGIPTVFQHRILFWGILGALIMRGIMIGAGVQLIEHFRGILYLFAAFLVFTGIKLFFHDDKSHDPSTSWAFRLTKRFVPMTKTLRDERFFVREDGRLLATPLFLVLIVIEATDLIFAVDSVPACLGISHDLFIVYTSNIFAILGLRALYFLLAGMMGELRFLKPALSIVLVYIGAKMLLAELHHAEVAWAFKIPTGLSLGVVGGILTLAVAASLLFPGKKPAPHAGGDLVPASDLPAKHDA
ncbi:MAG: TerC family protein [Planctomycetota bacterium]|nr:TerC family protein [Planctomycetota bacterium]